MFPIATEINITDEHLNPFSPQIDFTQIFQHQRTRYMYIYIRYRFLILLRRCYKRYQCSLQAKYIFNLLYFLIYLNFLKKIYKAILLSVQVIVIKLIFQFAFINFIAPHKIWKKWWNRKYSFLNSNEKYLFYII